jgi:transcriptional regulator GlxA family with amidase domain
MHQSAASTRNDPRTIGLLLIDDFALMSYAAIIEPYRAANVLAGDVLYKWVHISTGAPTIVASNGASFLAERTVRQALDCDVLFVFAGGDPSTFNDPATFAWLRKAALTRALIAGVSGGPFLLARAGLLDGYRATIHWEHLPAFIERFPMIATQPGLYVVDRRRVTCAGGTAGMDLAIDLIERDHGHDLASRVSDWFIRTEARAADKPQRLSLRERYNVRNDRLLRVLAQMEAFVEEPLSSTALAAAAGISVRQLERLFAAHLRQSVQETYRNIRLEQADQLLRTTGLSATAVAIACGFRSSSHFSRAFKARFGHPPTRAAGTEGG